MTYLTILEEDFNNYRLPAMFIGTISCGGKCCLEAGIPLCVCQNDQWRDRETKSINDDTLCDIYMKNPISKAIVFGGLEPFEQFEELLHFVQVFRKRCDDSVIIYTGYNKDEINEQVNQLKEYPNIIIKFGRYVPGHEKHFDEILGVSLASNNQYAERIS